jgi:hypothetical protein
MNIPRMPVDPILKQVQTTESRQRYRKNLCLMSEPFFLLQLCVRAYETEY